MRFVRLAIIGVLVGGVAIAGRAQGPATATFHGMGADPANVNFGSVVRGATKVGDTIFAVGSSSNQALLWTIADGASVVRTVLPNAPTFSGTPVPAVTAGAITPNADFIASQAKSPGGPVAVRVQTTGLATTNLNLAPFSPFTAPTAARAISDDGSVLYGVVNSNSQAARFDFAGPSSTLIPLLPGTTSGNQPAFGATSSDGSVMVGVSFTNPYPQNGTTNGHAFRYVHGSPSGTVSAIPELPGATWSKAVNVSPDGQLVLTGGNSANYANGETYIYNTTSGTTTRLGSPNLAWSPISVGGMTPDGSLVVQTFASVNNLNSRYPYFHNTHGWFQLASALADAGIDFAANGWTMEGGSVAGVSRDGTIVFGQALHETPAFRRFEAFVAELPPGYLANYDATPVAPSNGSIIGTWYFADPDPSNNPFVLFLLPNGVYYSLTANVPASEVTSANGFERGFYSWDPATSVFKFKTLQDTDGDSGASGVNGQSAIRVDVVGDNLTLSVEGCSDPGCAPSTGLRVIASPGSIVGGWIAGDSSQRESSLALLLMPDGTYYFVDDTDANDAGHAGIEKGTYSWDSITGAISTTTVVNTDGSNGLSNPPPGARTLILSSDELAFTYTDDESEVPAMRIIDYASVTPVITSALSATGTLGLSFTYTVTATHGLTFNATGLPAGLTIDSATGIISGTPTAPGTFDVTISATNTFDGTGSAPLQLVVAQPVVSLSVSSLVYGNQNVGTTSVSQGVTLSNTGNGSLALSLSITGGHAADFAQVNTCGASVAAGGACTISVTFTPTNTGTRIATVTLSDNATGSPQTIALSGTGKTGQIKMTPEPLVFGTQALGTTSGSLALKVQNTGTTVVNVTSIVSSGDFAVAGTTCGSTLAVAATCNVNVRFSPTAGGLRSGLLTVSTSAGNGSAALTGTGDIASVSPASVAFGNQAVGVNSAPRTVTLTNASASATLSIASVTITGTNAGDFTMTNACGSTLAPAANCGVAITFRPGKKGPRSASLTIVDNGGGPARTVSLTGFGK